MKSIITSVILSLFIIQSAYSQKQVYLHYVPKVGGVTLIPGEVVQDLAGTEMSIEFFNYYLSNLHLIHDGSQDLNLSDSVYLITIPNNTLDLGVLDITTISQVNFGVGVPQALNHLDISQYPEHHPLSYQTPSMQWGWTAGYAHMIVDGQGDSDNDGVPNSMFQLHNLGDASYQNVALPVLGIQATSTQIDIYISCNLDEWIYGNNPGTVGVVHGSGSVNAACMDNVETRSVFTSQADASLSTTDKPNGNLTSFATENNVKVNWSELSNASYYSLVDINGKTVQSDKMSEKQGETYFYNLTNGTYVFTAYSSAGDKLNQLRFIK